MHTEGRVDGRSQAAQPHSHDNPTEGAREIMMMTARILSDPKFLEEMPYQSMKLIKTSVLCIRQKIK